MHVEEDARVPERIPAAVAGNLGAVHGKDFRRLHCVSPKAGSGGGMIASPPGYSIPRGGSNGGIGRGRTKIQELPARPARYLGMVGGEDRKSMAASLAKPARHQGPFLPRHAPGGK